MVLGYHVIFGAYGFWLPNDPRGSWSEFVGSWDLFRFGHATTTNSRASVAGQPHNEARRAAAKAALKYPPVKFTGLQARAIGKGFQESARRGGVTVWACAILPEHVHLVLARHTCKVEQIVNCFKGESDPCPAGGKPAPLAAHRTAEGKVPKCWARDQWKVFLDSVEDIQRAIVYVEQNPVKEGKPLQRWSFVVPFDSAHV